MNNGRFLRVLMLVVAVFAAASAFVCTDGFREYEVGYVQGEMLKASSDSFTARPDRKAVYPVLVVIPGRSRFSSGSVVLLKSPALVCLSTCVLLC
jgi:hypothetical protein